MGKGYHGESCAEAMQAALRKLNNRASAQQIFDKVQTMGSWAEDTIWQHMMGFVVNLPPSYRHWIGVYPEDRFLFLKEDGTYELYSPQRHGEYLDGQRIVPSKG